MPEAIQYCEADGFFEGIDVTGMQAAGYTVTQRGTTIYTTDRVPPRFLGRIDSSR